MVYFFKNIFKNIFDIIATYLLMAIFYLIKLAPNKFKKKIVHYLVSVVIFFFPRAKYVTFRNISICFPEASRQEKSQIWNGMKLALEENILGFIQGPDLTKEMASTMIDFSESKESIDLILNNKGQGILFLVPHFGAFELFSHLWCLYDKPFAILARSFGLKRLDRLWNSYRESHGCKVFDRKGGYKKVVDHLKKGTNVALLFDQNVKQSHSIFVELFGVPASTTKTIALASLRTSSKIIFAAMVTLGNNKYKLIAKPISPPKDRPGSTEEKIYSTIKDVHNILEKCITDHPNEWFWLHRRFKTREVGEIENMYDPRKYPENL